MLAMIAWPALESFLFSTAGAVIGGSLVAWLGGYYSEKGKRKLLEEEFPKLLEQARSTAYEQEKGKNLATKEDVQQVLDQVRAVTLETETIKAGIQGGLWEKQWLLNQKKEAYARVLDLLARLASNALRSASHMRQYRGNLPPHIVQEALEIRRERLELERSVASALAVAGIFVNHALLARIELGLREFEALNSTNHPEGSENFAKAVSKVLFEFQAGATVDLASSVQRG